MTHPKNHRFAIAKGGIELRPAALATNPAEVLIYGDIGENWYDDGSVGARDFAEQLAKLDNDYIDVRINSYGGSVTDGLAIYNAIRRHKAAVTVSIDGIAASIASLIAMAGDTVEMADNALLMIHAPWSMAIGNANNMRKQADTLDAYAKAMTSAYSGRLSEDDALSLLTDGEDHWYTASDALALGLVDAVTQGASVAAAIPERYRPSNSGPQPKPIAQAVRAAIESPPAAPIAALQQEDTPMADPRAKAPEQPAADIITLTAKAKTEALAAVRERNAAIKARFEQLSAAAGEQAGAIRAVYEDAMADPEQTVDAFTTAALAALAAKPDEPIAGTHHTRIEGQLDASDKFRTGVSAALAHRMGLGADDRSNEFRGQSLSQLAAASLEHRGQPVKGMTRTEIASKVLAAHSGSDFPLLLANTANKALQQAYEGFPSTWSQIAATGEVSDFKTMSMIRLGSFNSLDTIVEGAEYTAGTVSEEAETIAAVTKGKFIQVTRQMIVNDDLSGFGRMAQMLGRAAARTVNKDVYSLINTNGNLANGRAIFNTTDKNLASAGAAISVSTLSDGRKAMRLQQDPSGHDYLNIMPRTLLVPVALEDHAREVVLSADNTDTTGSRKRNPIRDWGPLEIVSDPYLDDTSTTAWYMVADPMDVPLIEVRFLDGQQTPFVDSEEEFLTDAIRWKVRLDYGVAANDRRGGYKNAGA